MEILLFKTALFIYLISAAVYSVSLYIKRVFPAKMATWILFFAVIIHTFFLAYRYINTGKPPVVSLHEALSFFALAISSVYLAFQLKTKTRLLGAFVSPVAFILMLLASTGLGGYVSMPMKLQGSLLPIHVTLSVAGEAFFSLASCAAAMYLIQERMIRKKKTSSLTRVLPSLRDLDRINHISLLWGFPLLTIGILIGSIWARTAWGSLWQWDPKQIWTLAAWIVYAFILHQRLAIGWGGRKPAFFCLAAFIILLTSLFAVNLLFETAHSFI